MKMKKIGISLIAAMLLNSSLVAVEYGSDTVVVENSPSMQVESSFQESEPSVTGIRSEFEDAESLANKFLDSIPNLQRGWNPETRTLIVVQTAIRNVDDDPEYSKNFMNMRNMASIEAVLRAKADVIKSIRTNMSAADILVGPGSNLDEELSKDLKNAKRKFEAQEKKLKKLLKEENIAYENFQAGVTFKDRANAFFDAAIKKLDEKYDAKNIEAKKRAKLDQIKKKVLEANAAFESASQRLKSLEGTIKQEQTSVRELFSSMPIFGATVVEQFESYNEDKNEYKNCVIMMWSPKTEEIAVAMLKGENVVVPPGSESLKNYLKSNKEAFLTTTGGRRFRDDKGNVYFLGIAAQEKGSSASSQRRAMSMAKIEAQTQLAFALYADVKSQEMMESKEIVRNAGLDKDITQSLTSLSETLSQSIKNMQIQGASEVYSTTGVHPLSGKEIFVSVYAISLKSAQNAMKAEASSYLSKIGYLDAQQKSKARKDAMVNSVKRKKNDKSTYNKEYHEYHATSKKIEQKSSKQAREHSQVVSKTTGIKSGSYRGVSNKDSFDW